MTIQPNIKPCKFEYQREQGELMLERMRESGLPAGTAPVDDRYPDSSWQVSGSQLFRCSTERERTLHVPLHGSTTIEWCLYADAVAAFESEYVTRPAGWHVRVCYRLEGMSGYQHVNQMVPLPLDVDPCDLDACVSHLVNTARSCIADGMRLGRLRTGSKVQA